MSSVNEVERLCDHDEEECKRALADLKALHDEIREITNRLIDIRAKVKHIENAFGIDYE